MKEQMENYIKQTKPDREVEKKERQDVIAFIDSEPVAALFESYKKPLGQMYKFYAAQDDKKDAAAYSIDYLHAMLDLTEFIRFGYHQKVTPDLLTPDDMMYIYKNLLGESQDLANSANDPTSELNRISGMIDYESFKKAIVRISVMAQDKLGVGANEDLLKQKLERDAKVKEAEKKRKQDLAGQVKASDTKRKEELAGLRQ